MAVSVTNQQLVSALYVAVFNRAPDKAGLDSWVAQMAAGKSFAEVSTGFTGHEVFTQGIGTLSNAAYVAALYTNVLGSAGDAAGVAGWVALLNAGASKASIAASFVQAALTVDIPALLASGALTAADAAAAQVRQDTLTNKANVGIYFTTTLGAASNLNAATVTSSKAGLEADPIYNASKAAIANVTNTAASVTAARDNIAVAAGSTNPAQSLLGGTVTLTDAVQALVGGSGVDNFVAGVGGNTQATLNLGDSIDGGAGKDTLSLFGNANAAAFATANVTNVEVIRAQVSNAGATALSVSANAGVTEAGLIAGSTGANTVSLTKTQTGTLQGAVGNTATFAFTAVDGTSDTATLAVNGATAATGVTVAGIESLTINTTGANTLGTLTAAATNTLTVTGAGTLNATAAGGTFKVIDASTNTGGVTLNIAALAAADLKVTGGTGNDEITVDFLNLTKADVINLGSGTDTLSFATTNVVLDSTTVGQLAGVTGVETLKVIGAATLTSDNAQVTQSLFNVSTTGKAVFTNVSNTDTITLAGATNATNTIGLELGQNTLNLALAGSATAAATGTEAVTGSTIVNIVSSGTAGVADNSLALTTADNNAINVTGSQNLTLTVTGAGAVTGQTVNAAAFTGKLSVTGSAVADTIIGGSGADTITGGLGADKLTGGAGADTFVFTAGSTGATLGNFDTIADFVVGTDKLQFAGVTEFVSGQQAAVQAAVTGLAAGSTAAQIYTAMATANTTDLAVSFATYNGNTYALYEAVGTDIGATVADNAFIQLAGVTTLPTFAADVIA